MFFLQLEREHQNNNEKNDRKRRVRFIGFGNAQSYVLFL